MKVNNKPRSFFDAISSRMFCRGMATLCIRNITLSPNRLRIISKRYNKKYILEGRDSFPLMSQSDMYDNMYSINDPLNLGMPERDYDNYTINPTLREISTYITKEGY